MSFDPVRDAGAGLLSRVSKAVSAAVAAGLAAAGVAIQAGQDPVAVVVAGVVAALAGLSVTYVAPANKQ